MIFCACSKNTTPSTQKETVIPAWAPEKSTYKPAKEKKMSIVHTLLKVDFDIPKHQLRGKATLTLKPYFYPQNQVILDAKGFDIIAVQLLSPTPKTLTYEYNGKILTITLDKTYTKNTELQIFIDYIAKPDELKLSGSDAISSDKGLFFIQPDSLNPSKPFQIWTQGEPESSSCWFPTIEATNQKMTQELFITVPKKYVTLSNGDLIYSTMLHDTLRTDYWRMMQPHAPYLTMMAVGNFAVVEHDYTYKYCPKIPVKYYVEPDYKAHAKAIFGRTPEMIDYFSKLLNYPYPWTKYSSVIVRDYVSGAMENTTSSLFGDFMQKNSRQILDHNFDNIVAHELFHHWFGDLLTCESWANLPLNESFANYSEYLWEEYKSGTDAAEYLRMEEMENYKYEAYTKREPIIRYYHDKPDDMFDSHSYSKGGCTLHMLRRHVGDEAFFKALHLYLTRYAYKSVEIHDLRLVLEEVTGRDLNPFFDQWFLGNGHPELNISDKYIADTLYVTIAQQQDTIYSRLFKFDSYIDYWIDSVKYTYPINVSSSSQTLKIPCANMPQLVIFDPNLQLIADVSHKKTLQEFCFQYKAGYTFPARHQAIDALANYFDTSYVRSTLIGALKDPFWKIRELALASLSKYKGVDTTLISEQVCTMAKADAYPYVRAMAIEKLAKSKKPQYHYIYKTGLQDSSYAVVAASLYGLLQLAINDSVLNLQPFENEQNPDIIEALSEYYVSVKDTSKYTWLKSKLSGSKPMDYYQIIINFGKLATLCDTAIYKDALTLLERKAMSHSSEWVRFAAYRAINIFDKKYVAQTIARIKAAEKSDRLKNYYKTN
ncbi:MAG: M1 family metallopeptidase [Cytophagales bacterium]|nr:M1 family metallopeptidase [Cytophagales bacterium]